MLPAYLLEPCELVRFWLRAEPRRVNVTLEQRDNHKRILGVKKEAFWLFVVQTEIRDTSADTIQG